MLSEMDLEAMMSSEELVVTSCNNDATNIAKGKRTKRRLRPLSPCGGIVTTTAIATTTAIITTAATSSCSSASGGGGISLSSTTFEEEEEDMANCLILLAQGRGGGGDPYHHKELCGEVKGEKGSTKNIDFYVYECKTCNKTFPSFQALGGHRASHKKPKLEEKKPSPTSSPPLSLPPPPASSQLFNFEEAKQSHMKIVTPSISLQLGCGNNRGGLNFHGNKSKIHECSICGAEFTSGQALGGHMRRHRASTNNIIMNNNNNNTVQTTTKTSDGAVQVKARNVLELDLNLPAPEDDLRDSKFQFPANKNSMMLSAAPALVGCHY